MKEKATGPRCLPPFLGASRFRFRHSWPLSLAQYVGRPSPTNPGARGKPIRKTETSQKLDLIIRDNAHVANGKWGYSRGSLGFGPGR